MCSYKCFAEPMPLVVVGGAAALCADQLSGISTVVRPPFADVANAIGAAIPQVRLFGLLIMQRNPPACLQNEAQKSLKCHGS